MIGEIAAILGNSDPASIEYKNTVDTLNAFAVEKKFPAEMQTKLREFFVSASSMFRNVYYRKMLLSLSPGLQQTIAKEEIGRFIMAIPFFRYAICRTLDIKRGTSVDVVQKGGPLRPATVDRPTTEGASFDVRYDDDFEPDSERRVAHERLVYFRGPECKRCVHEVQMMVRELSLHMQCVSFMANETMVHQGISWNDELFILVEGRAVVFDATRHAIHGKELVTPRTNSVVGRDICAYLCNRKKVPRKYTCKLLTHSLVYAVDAETFCDLLSRGHYKALYRGMAFYGSWIVLRNALLAWVDERRTRPPEKPRRKSGVVFLETPPPKAKSPLALQAAAPAELRPRSGAAILAPRAAPEPDVAALLRAQAAALDAQRDALAALAAKVDALIDHRRPPAADDGGGREFLPGA